ncbi:MAG: hypothetical protein ACTSVV_09040 [Promethearchaeota archaeon]
MRRALLLNLIFLLITIFFIILSFTINYFFFLPIFCFLPLTCGSKGIFSEEIDSFKYEGREKQGYNTEYLSHDGIRVCPNCGKTIIIPDAKYCYYCSAKLE